MKTRSALAAFGGVAIAVAGAAGAEDPTAALDDCIGRLGAPADHADQCFGAQAEACMAMPENQTTAGMVACLDGEAAAWGAILDREYQALDRSLDDEQRIALADAQRKWREFRDAECAFPQVFIGGSMAPPWSADCVMQFTARRVLDLRGYRDFMEY